MLEFFLMTFLVRLLAAMPSRLGPVTPRARLLTLGAPKTRSPPRIFIPSMILEIESYVNGVSPNTYTEKEILLSYRRI